MKPPTPRKESKSDLQQSWDARLKNVLGRVPAKSEKVALKKAIDLGTAYYKEPIKRTADDYISDPLVIVSILQKYADPDRATILAAPLVGAVRAMGPQSPNPDLMEKIEREKSFPDGTRELLEDMRRFRSYNLPNFVVNDPEHHSDYIALFRQTSLWETSGPGGISLGAAQLIDNLDTEVNHPGRFPSQILNRFLVNAEHVYAPILDVLGLTNMKLKLLELVDQIRDPDEFRNMRKAIASVARPQDMNPILEAVAACAENALSWKRGVHFAADDIREKSAASAKRKLIRKNETVIARWRAEHPGDRRDDATLLRDPELQDKLFDISDLSDVYALRLIPKVGSIDWMYDSALKPDGTMGMRLRPVEELNTSEYRRLRRDLEKKCFELYGEISKALGRGNTRKMQILALDERGRPIPLSKKDNQFQTESRPYLKEEFDRLAEMDARSEDPSRLQTDEWTKNWVAWEKQRYPNIRDARFVDHYGFPKPKSKSRKYPYRALHDVINVFIAGKYRPVRVELHIVDELQHAENNETHAGYKGNMIPGMNNYWRMAKAKKAGEDYKGPRHVAVFTADERKVIDISAMPTLAGYMQKTGETFKAACITDNHTRFSGELITDLDAPLPNGVRIHPLPDYSPS